MNKIIGECLWAACKGPFFVWYLKARDPDDSEADQIWLNSGRRRWLVSNDKFMRIGSEDWSEFSTLVGLTRSEVEKVASSWPENAGGSVVELAVNNVLNNLLGYPHKCDDIWSDFISVSRAELNEVFLQWRKTSVFGAPAEGDSPASTYFNRIA